MLLTSSSPSTSLVLDLGTSSTKYGWSTHEEPEVTLDTVVGRGPHPGAMKHLGLLDTYVGSQAQKLRGILNLRAPLNSGEIEHWDDLEALWTHIYETVISSVESFRVLVSIPPLLSLKDRTKLSDLLLDTPAIEGVYLANKSVLAMYGGGRTTGICVDSGEDMSYIVPCWEGNPILPAVQTLPLGGKHVTKRLLEQLSDGKYSFIDDTFFLWNRKSRRSRNDVSGKAHMVIASRIDVVREAKETFCRFSNLRQSDNEKESSEREDILRLQGGNIVVVGKEASSAPEILFSPERHHGLKGLHEILLDSLLLCDERIRSRLLSNIMLTGGNTLIKGMDIRLQNEMLSLLPDTLSKEDIKVVAQADREIFTWTGGAHLCGLSSFEGLWKTKQDFKEIGGDINQNKERAINYYNNNNNDIDLDITMTSQIL